MKNKDYCQSFKPIVDNDSRVLILGSMPGPMALRKQQYYGFEGNHFWTIVPSLFNTDRPKEYAERIALVRHYRIALWDVLASCVRPGAADLAIKKPKLNPIPGLLKKYPGIGAVFINGRTAYDLFVKEFGSLVTRPVVYLPSSSPAHASMPVKEKIKKWAVILDYLKN